MEHEENNTTMPIGSNVMLKEKRMLIQEERKKLFSIIPFLVRHNSTQPI